MSNHELRRKGAQCLKVANARRMTQTFALCADKRLSDTTFAVGNFVAGQTLGVKKDILLRGTTSFVGQLALVGQIIFSEYRGRPNESDCRPSLCGRTTAASAWRAEALPRSLRYRWWQHRAAVTLIVLPDSGHSPVGYPLENARAIGVAAAASSSALPRSRKLFAAVCGRSHPTGAAPREWAR